MALKENIKYILNKLIPGLYYQIRLSRLFKRFSKYEESYLVKTGYLTSFKKGYPVNLGMEPLPWMNYPFLGFIKKRLNNNQNLFEFGSGYSTVFFAKKLKSVTSVEYDKEWFEKAQGMTKGFSNTEIIFQELNEDYPKTINKTDKKYELIVIDGRKRVKCALNSYGHLTSDGILILDDSSRDEYHKIWDFYLKKGFREITFQGLKPNGFSIDHTTVFYRDGNCLGI
ncbi:MAG: class I SAM-dependent methyltransferase [Chlorobi bacterium]|nr:class I SAM-dependent methyltransferase [Chlorobiota bacterium]